MAYVVAYNPSAPVGERLAPEVRTEIALLAPVTIPNGSVTNPRIADEAVEERNVRDDTIRESHVRDAAVSTRTIAPDAVTRDRIAPASVDHTRVDAGVPTVTDVDDQPIALKFIPLTAAQYAGITPDPNTAYLIY